MSPSADGERDINLLHVNLKDLLILQDFQFQIIRTKRNFLHSLSSQFVIQYESGKYIYMCVCIYPELKELLIITKTHL